METRERCPQCLLGPDVFMENQNGEIIVVFHCPRHGHRAQGKSTAQANLHWNIYIEFIRKEAAVKVA